MAPLIVDVLARRSDLSVHTEGSPAPQADAPEGTGDGHRNASRHEAAGTALARRAVGAPPARRRQILRTVRALLLVALVGAAMWLAYFSQVLDTRGVVVSGTRELAPEQVAATFAAAGAKTSIDVSVPQAAAGR